MPQISDLNQVTTFTGAEMVPVVQGGVTKKALLRPLPNVKDFGATGLGIVDDTSAFTTALALVDALYVPKGTYKVSSLTIPANKTIVTDGYNTIIQQVAGVPAATPIITIAGSNIFFGGVWLKGNISTDTGEHNAGIVIRGSTNINRIKIGDIVGENIRGDVLYIGGLSTATVSDVEVASVHGINIYRNVVSNTGGTNCRIHSITATSVGYALYDEEPNGNSCDIGDNWIGYAKASVVQVAGLPGHIVSNTRFGVLDLNPAHQTNTTPVYPSYDVSTGMRLRNCDSVFIGCLTGADYNSALITIVKDSGVGDQQVKLLDIGWLEAENCSITDAVYNAYIKGSGLDCLTIRGGNVALTSSIKCLVLGDSTMTSILRTDLRHIAIDGTLARYCKWSLFEDIRVNSASDVYLALGCLDSKLSRSTVTLGRLFGNCENMVVEQSSVTAATFLFNSSFDDHLIIDSTLNTVYYKLGPYLRNYANALNFGTFYLWVDATGDLRIKNGVPTTDLDGTVVGTQT